MFNEPKPPITLPAYDVVIPSFNRAAVVADAVESVANQCHPPTRIIVVDDGSNDDTAAALAALERRQPSVRAVLMPRNGGASAARNAGLALVREEWVAFLDSDDRWLPGAADALLSATPEFDVVVGQFRRSGLGQDNGPAECGWDGRDIRGALSRSGAIGPSWSVIRTAVARAIGGFDPSFHNCNDWDFYTRAAAAGARFGRVYAAVALYHCADAGRLSHDRAVGGVNAARVLRHSYFADLAA